MDCDGTLIIDILAKVLGKLIDINERDCKTQQSVIPVKFTSSVVPEMSIWDYLERIKKYSKCSESCFVVALIYIDRAIEIKNLVLSNLNIHRILITSILIAVKFLDDSYMNNAFYAKLGGISTREMNMLELEFLLFLGFSLQVSSDLYSTYHNELKGYVCSNRLVPFYDCKSYDRPYCNYVTTCDVDHDDKDVNNSANTKQGIFHQHQKHPIPLIPVVLNDISKDHNSVYSNNCNVVRTVTPDHVITSPCMLLNRMESAFFNTDQARFLISYSGYSVQF